MNAITENLRIERPTFTRLYMDFAMALSHRSDCKRRSVGAVVTDSAFTKVYAHGYNGGAAGQGCSCTGEQGNCGCVHAEMNALLKCSTEDKQKILFCTVFPCKLCAKMIVNSGFIKVYFAGEYRDAPVSDEILKAANIEVICMRDFYV